MKLKYLCLVYEEEAIVDALPNCDLAAIGNEYRDELGELTWRGNFLSSARLQPAEMAATVRFRNGSVSISDVAVIGTEARLAGFHLIDARDLNDAIRIVARMPRTHLGWVEVRPLEECRPG